MAAAGTHPCTTLTKSNKLTANNLELFGESRWTLTSNTVVSAGGQWTAAQRRVAPGDMPAAPGFRPNALISQISLLPANSGCGRPPLR